MEIKKYLRSQSSMTKEQYRKANAISLPISLLILLIISVQSLTDMASGNQS